MKPASKCQRRIRASDQPVLIRRCAWIAAMAGLWIGVALLLSACKGNANKADARDLAQGMPDDSLAKTAQVEAEQAARLAHQLRLDVEATPDADLPGRKAEIIERLKGLEASAEKVSVYAVELKKRVDRDKPILKTLEAWSIRTLGAGVVCLVLGIGLYLWRGSAVLLWIGSALAAIGAALYALSQVLWWAAMLAGAGILVVLGLLLYRRYRLWVTAGQVVRSVDTAIAAGALVATSRDAMKRVMDPIQGAGGKALVDAWQDD